MQGQGQWACDQSIQGHIVSDPVFEPAGRLERHRQSTRLLIKSRQYSKIHRHLPRQWMRFYRRRSLGSPFKLTTQHLRLNLKIKYHRHPVRFVTLAHFHHAFLNESRVTKKRFRVFSDQASRMHPGERDPWYALWFPAPKGLQQDFLSCHDFIPCCCDAITYLKSASKSFEMILQ
ncbi:MAG: hypothetical protein BWY82_00630 [Verrucomicrobia bacterium ADurb.Bin474]|nr:MAG: hypothetical protein BWY82_00630 [Verrucomicrobia bacterium ADurb.Bin474]